VAISVSLRVCRLEIWIKMSVYYFDLLEVMTHVFLIDSLLTIGKRVRCKVGGDERSGRFF
jgi:hypothetical protein